MRVAVQGKGSQILVGTTRNCILRGSFDIPFTPVRYYLIESGIKFDMRRALINKVWSAAITVNGWSYGGINGLVRSSLPIAVFVFRLRWTTSTLGHHESYHNLGQRYQRPDTICLFFAWRPSTCYCQHLWKMVCHGFTDPRYLRNAYGWHGASSGN